MILEGAMVATACIALTMAHPGFVFGRAFNGANARFARARGCTPSSEMELVESEHSMVAAKPT